MATATEPAEKPRTEFTLQQACAAYGLSYTTLWRRVNAGEFTTIRDGHGQGFPILLRKDELDVYKGRNDRYPAGGLASLRRFRREKGRK